MNPALRSFSTSASTAMLLSGGEMSLLLFHRLGCGIYAKRVGDDFGVEPEHILMCPGEHIVVLPQKVVESSSFISSGS